MPSTEKLAELIGRKHRLLTQLRDVGGRQMELMACGETASLLKLLAAKQNLIAELQGLEREMSPFQLEDPDARVWRTPEDRARCAAQAADCNRLLQEVLQLEKRSADAMIARRNEVAERLEQVHAAAQIRSAYEAQRQGPLSADRAGVAAR